MPEQSLDKKTTLGLYLTEIAKTPRISREKERELFRRIKQGDEEALDEVVKANLRFVVSVAKQYQGLGLPLMDLISEGNLGLMRAARRFDGERGVKFISYAVWWIRQAIQAALAENKYVTRLPMNWTEKLNKVNKASHALSQELAREPEIREIAEELGFDEREVEKVLRLGRRYSSLDAPFSEDVDEGLLAVLRNGEEETIDERIDEERLKTALRKLIDRLPKREATVIRLYFGLDGSSPLTLEEIGNILGLSRERIRQIRDRALDTLKRARWKKYLDPFFE